MLIAAAAILVGFIVLIWSADLFVAGAASIAENMGMSPIIIGLTIVSLGTSAPEVLVSVIASMSDAGDLAIGNAVGSNIANIGLVLGISLLVVPMCVHCRCMTQEMPVLLAVTLGVGCLLLDGELSVIDGYLMVGVLVLLIAQMVRNHTRADPEEEEQEDEEEDDEPLPHLAPKRAAITFFIGLLLLVASSRLLVWGAITIAEQLGVPQLIIGLTIVAVGTSLPELAATVASALKGHPEIALGNVIGSNLFNLLAVMSIPGILGPEILAAEILPRDYLTMTCLTLFLALGIYVSRKRRNSPAGYAYLGRTMGTLLVSFYAMYYYRLFLSL